MKNLLLISRILTVFPTLFILTFYSFVVYFYFENSHFPNYGDKRMYYLDLIIPQMFNILLISILLQIGLLVYLYLQKKLVIKNYLLWLLSIFLVLFLFTNDPLNLWSWYFD